MFGGRLEEVFTGLGLKQRTFAVFVKMLGVDGLSENALSVARADPEYNPSVRLLDDLSKTLFVSSEWLRGGSDERWANWFLDIRHQLLQWAKSSRTLKSKTPGGRLVAVFEKMHSLIPDLPELVWAAYTTVIEPEKLEPNTLKYDFHMDEWLGIKQGSEPAGAVISRASVLTGLPVDWFDAGDPSTLNLVSAADLERLRKYLSAHGYSVDDAIGLIEDGINARHAENPR